MITQYSNPNVNEWASLCERPILESSDLEPLIKQIFTEIEKDGDRAVNKYTALFDGCSDIELTVTADEITAANNVVSDSLKSAIKLAATNIEKFHRSQSDIKNVVETTSGVSCWRENRAIQNVGIYIPGGSAPLFSTVLMLAIPAKIAGCKQIILCTPPDRDGKIDPAILYAANLIGVTSIFKVGGIQAIGAMTIGTATIPEADKIFGPGNQYVTAAKQFALRYGIAIDMPAGPSEVLVIADESANPEFVAADLLAQAEHGPDSQVILLSDSAPMIEAVNSAIERQITDLSRSEIITTALSSSKAILLKSIAECISFSNVYAPEHLIIAVNNADDYLDQVQSAGSVFIGNYSCESVGDYASGPNHTLPTNGYARNYSGVSVDSYVKKITFQKITADGIRNIGPSVEIMAAAEKLDAHKNAVTVRLKQLQNV